MKSPIERLTTPHDIKILENALDTSYGLKSLMELYRSDKYSPFLFSRRTMIVLSLIWIVIIIIIGLVNFLPMLEILWILFTSYWFFYIGKLSWYKEWTFEWISDGFDLWSTNTELNFFKTLLREKIRKNPDAEKTMISDLTVTLSNKFSNYTEFDKADYNKDLIEFKLKKIIDKECDFYWNYWSKI